MKASIEAKDRDEKSAIVRAMTDPETRAHVIAMGHLLGLPDDASRVRVLRMLAIFFEDRNGHPPGSLYRRTQAEGMRLGLDDGPALPRE